MLDALKNRLFFENDDLQVHWLGGAVVLCVRDDVVLVDTPPGLVHILDKLDLIQGVRSVAVSSGKIASTGGLISIMDAMARHHSADFPFVLRGPIADERPGIMVEAWSRGWPDRFSIGLDGMIPGTNFQMGPFHVRTIGLEIGEPLYQPEAQVRGTMGLGWRFELGDTAIVWIRTCAPLDALARFCQDATLAILEVGVQTWPKSDRRWRLSVNDASRYGVLAQELWLVGDEGGPLNVDLIS